MVLFITDYKSVGVSLGVKWPEVQILSARPQVIPEGAGPVKTNLWVVVVRFARFLVLVVRVEVRVGVKARAEPDRLAAVRP